MVVNDYYDSRSGVDKIMFTSPRNVNMYPADKPLVTGEVSFSMVKEFLYYLYSCLLVTLTFIPGSPTRLSAVTATILTFIYTKHLKPRTWVKNISCATLMALSPFTSGAATLYTIMTDGKVQSLLESISLTATIPQGMSDILRILMTSIGPLVLTLFCGFMTREIIMDVSDYESDKTSGIMTIPVRYGRRMAIRVALGFLAAMCISACVHPIWQVVNLNWNRVLLPTVGHSNYAWRWTRALWIVLKTPVMVKACFSVLGSVWMMIRMLQVHRTEGEDKRILDRFIEEGKGAISFILASFIF